MNGELQNLTRRTLALSMVMRRSWLAVFFLGLLCGDIRGVGGQVSELGAKAEFLFRLARFVDWDESDEADEAKSFLIGILGDPDFSKAVRQVVKGRTIGGRAIRVVDAESFRELTTSKVAFVAGSSRRQLSVLMKERPAGGTLLLGESEAFLKAGGMISMIRTRSGKIQLIARSETLEASGLRISSKLLRILQR